MGDVIKFYTSHCQNCMTLKNIMDINNIKYKEIDDFDIYMPIAKKNNIFSMPFAEINKKIYNTTELQDHIRKMIEE